MDRKYSLSGLSARTLYTFILQPRIKSNDNILTFSPPASLWWYYTKNKKYVWRQVLTDSKSLGSIEGNQKAHFVN